MELSPPLSPAALSHHHDAFIWPAGGVAEGKPGIGFGFVVSVALLHRQNVIGGLFLPDHSQEFPGGYAANLGL